MNIINIATILLLFLVGVFIKYKKVTWLISGYNTASKEEKEKYDIDKLCHHMGNMILLTAFIWGVITVACFLFVEKTALIITIGCIALVFVLIGGIIYMNTGNRVKK